MIYNENNSSESIIKNIINKSKQFCQTFLHFLTALTRALFWRAHNTSRPPDALNTSPACWKAPTFDF